jgi:hypothetical protein
MGTDDFITLSRNHFEAGSVHSRPKAALAIERLDENRGKKHLVRP